MSAAESLTSPQQALGALLAQQAPQQVLLVSNSALPAVQAWQEAHPECQLSHNPAQALTPAHAGKRYDLAILADCLEHLDKRSALELIGGIRNLNASRLAVLVDLAACELTHTDFYAQALQVSEQFTREQQTLTLFTYDLLQYKQAPDWLNNRFWANPENFGKYWW